MKEKQWLPAEGLHVTTQRFRVDPTMPATTLQLMHTWKAPCPSLSRQAAGPAPPHPLAGALATAASWPQDRPQGRHSRGRSAAGRQGLRSAGAFRCLPGAACLQATSRTPSGWAWTAPFNWTLWVALLGTLLVFPPVIFLLEFGSLRSRIHRWANLQGVRV